MIVQIKREAAEALEFQRKKHEAEMEAVFRRFYGPKSERFDPRQLLMFGIVIDSVPLDEQAIEAESGEKLDHAVYGQSAISMGVIKLPESLPRIPIEHDLSLKRSSAPAAVPELPHRQGSQRAT